MANKQKPTIKKACEYDYYKACGNLERIEKDKEKLVAIFKKMCDNGNGRGCSYLASYYEDHKQIIATYVKACEFAIEKYGATSNSGSPVGCSKLENIYNSAFVNSYGRDFESEEYWLGYHRGDSKKAKQSVKEVKQMRNEIRSEFLKYLPNLCKTKGGKTCDLLWKIGNN